jgi:broad specificity phosphatase PhoE
VKTTKQSGKRIILIRHGETGWNRLHRFQGRSDLPLNQKGNKQARALALALKNEAITVIYSSPLGRAIETAFHIGRFHPSAPLIKESGLMEMDLGDFEGMEAQRWATQHQDFRKVWEKNPATLAMPGGESLKEVQQRAVDTLERISEPYDPGSTLLICSHNFVIVSLLCFASKTSLDQFRELRQDTAALNIIYKDGEDFQVEKVNDCRHLQELFLPGDR